MSSCMALVLTDLGAASVTILASARFERFSVLLRRSRNGRHRRRSRAPLAEFLGEFRQRLEQIGDQAVIRDLKDRSLFILVDGDDHLGILHAGKMLDRAGDADRDIELRRHHFAGLAYLPIVGSIAGVHRGPRGADIGADPPVPVAWKVAVRTVITFLASRERTVWMALPA